MAARRHRAPGSVAIGPLRTCLWKSTRLTNACATLRAVQGVRVVGPSRGQSCRSAFARSSRAAGRGRDARLQTVRPRAAATTIAGPLGPRLTADPSLTHGRKAGLTLRHSATCACVPEKPRCSPNDPLDPRRRPLGFPKVRCKPSEPSRRYLPVSTSMTTSLSKYIAFMLPKLEDLDHARSGVQTYPRNKAP